MKIKLGDYTLDLAAPETVDLTPLLGWGILGLGVLAIAATALFVLGNEIAEGIWGLLVVALAFAAISYRHEIAALLGI
ncbi:hypothetical protein [Geminicoccus harenae]|uniref:hypothetical protein n=1 Tax=Geminicoccus harenae TaxID=2498453 RepID=UPI00168B94AA|nr:hypothetical protein [Geminicoccus harenae]